MKKTAKAIVLFICIMICITCIGLCFSVTYYNWTDEALNAKLVRIENSFTLEKSATTVTANGELMNCTNTALAVNKGELIIYCQDNSTDEIYSFKNTASYNFEPEKETTIHITIYKGAINTENSKLASQIVENYRIIKIEYQLSENEIYKIPTIVETGSYFVYYGIIAGISTILASVIISVMLALQMRKHTNENNGNSTLKQKISIDDLNYAIKNLPFIKKILILSIALIIYIAPIVAGVVALLDNYWSLTFFAIVSAVLSVGILINLSFIGVITIRKILLQKTQKLSKKIETALNHLIETKNSEIKDIKETLNEEEKKLSSQENELANEQYTAIRAYQSNISQYKQKISEYKAIINSRTQSVTNLQQQIERAKKESLELELKNLHRLDGWQFETYCANLFRKLGYSVRLTKGSGDFGADLILNNSISVQCKLYSNPVGLHALQEVYSSMAQYKTTSAWVVTNSTFTKQAIEYANNANIKLIDYAFLKSLIGKVLANNKEIDINSTNKINEIRTEIANLYKSIDELSAKISEERNEISRLEISIEEIPAIIALREKMRKFKEQCSQKIDNLLKEIQELQSDISALNRLERHTTKEIGKKYNIS